MHAALIPDQSHLRGSFRRAGDDGDSYRLWTDGPVLRIEARGHWDMAVVQSYARDIVRIVAALRAIRPGLRAIVDRRDVPTFEPDVHARLQALFHNIQQPGDRIAMVVDCSLTKGRLRQIAGRETTQSFLSTSAAQTWVLAYD